MSTDFDSTQEVLKTVINSLKPLNDEQRRFVLVSVAAWFNDSDKIIPTPPAKNGDTETEPKNLQDFVFYKKTKNDSEAVAVLAYYLEKYRGQKLFKTADLEILNKEAGTGQKFGNIIKTVNNATQRNQFFATAGNRSKQLTPLGRMIVEALPNEEEVKSIIEKNKPRIKRKPNKKNKVEE